MLYFEESFPTFAKKQKKDSYFLSSEGKRMALLSPVLGVLPLFSRRLGALLRAQAPQHWLLTPHHSSIFRRRLGPAHSPVLLDFYKSSTARPSRQQPPFLRLRDTSEQMPAVQMLTDI